MDAVYVLIRAHLHPSSPTGVLEDLINDNVEEEEEVDGKEDDEEDDTGPEGKRKKRKRKR